MYPSCFDKKFPTGFGFIWDLNGRVFNRRKMTERKVSLGCIQWLDYIQNSFDELIDKNGQLAKIRHGWNSKEMRFGKYFVDGYALVDDRQLIFEYDGCIYHDCERCDREALFKRDESERNAFLQSLPKTTIIRITECEWQEKMKILTYEPKISPILFHNKVYPEQMLKLLGEKKLYGFMLVDIVGTEKTQKFLDINWPPILRKAMVDFYDLPLWMQQNVDEKDFPKEQIVQSMHATELLLHTCLLEFYLENGFKITKIHKFFEYEGSECFEKVFKTVYEARVQVWFDKKKIILEPIHLFYYFIFNDTKFHIP